MGLFDTNGGKSYYQSSSEAFLNPNAGSSSRRGVSPARSVRSVKTSTSSGGGGYFVRPSNSASHARPGYARSASGSILGNFGGSGWGGGSTSRGIFSSGGSSSYYKRQPRRGYVSYLLHKLQRMIKELWYYARRHPVKAFFAVVVPLLSAGGAIHGLLRQFGIRLPMGLDGGGSSLGGGYYGSRGYGGDRGGLLDSLGGASGLMSMARMFV